VELARRQLAAAKDENAKRSVWYAIEEVLELWNSDPSNIAKTLTRNHINIFSPEQRL
jgi:Tat protein secretion system quality control protein TatD with DNase activity